MADRAITACNADMRGMGQDLRCAVDAGGQNGVCPFAVKGGDQAIERALGKGTGTRIIE